MGLKTKRFSSYLPTIQSSGNAEGGGWPVRVRKLFAELKEIEGGVRQGAIRGGGGNRQQEPEQNRS